MVRNSDDEEQRCSFNWNSYKILWNSAAPITRLSIRRDSAILSDGGTASSGLESLSGNLLTKRWRLSFIERNPVQRTIVLFVSDSIYEHDLNWVLFRITTVNNIVGVKIKKSFGTYSVCSLHKDTDYRFNVKSKKLVNNSYCETCSFTFNIR